MANARIVRHVDPASTVFLGPEPGHVAAWFNPHTPTDRGEVLGAAAVCGSIARRGLVGRDGIKLLCERGGGTSIGEIVAIEYRGDRIWIEARLNLNISYARDLYELARGGEMRIALDYRAVSSERRRSVGVTVHTEADLRAASIVPATSSAERVVQNAPTTTRTICTGQPATLRLGDRAR